MNLYDIRITGKDVKRFIHNLYKQKIQFFNIEYPSRNQVIVRVGEVDYKRILDIKTIYEIDVVRLHGPVRLFSFIFKYRLFFGCLFLGFIFLFFLTRIIFDVQVIHNKSEIRNLILEELDSLKISKYHLVVSFDKQEEIVDKIIKKYRDKIEWMELERVGVRYIVKVEERKVKDLDSNDIPRDLVAKKDGMISQIEATTGEVKVSKGQYVKKGDILVSGLIKNKDLVMAKVAATGKVFAETWYDVTVELPYYYSEESKTGNEKYVLTFNFFNNSYNIFDFNSYTDKKIETKFSLGNLLLPISFSWNKEIEIDKKEQIYSRDMAIVAASSKAREKLTNKLGKEDKILYEKSLKITEEDSKIIVVFFFKVKEDITAYQEIQDENLETGS
ncbi:MAG: hypothetical protein E7168_02215 [Firmicutes bacterium]|nr:hypothetical protein [Bacillota bacterium]